MRQATLAPVSAIEEVTRGKILSTATTSHSEARPRCGLAPPHQDRVRTLCELNRVCGRRDAGEALRLHGTGRVRTGGKRVIALLTRSVYARHAARYPHELSGGRQLVATRVRYRWSGHVVCDEPWCQRSSIDPAQVINCCADAAPVSLT